MNNGEGKTWSSFPHPLAFDFPSSPEAPGKWHVCMTRMGVRAPLQLTGLGPVQTGPGRLAVPVQRLPSNGYEMLSSQEKQDTHEVEPPVFSVSVCMLTLGRKAIRNQGQAVLVGLKEFCLLPGLRGSHFCPASIHYRP